MVQTKQGYADYKKERDESAAQAMSSGRKDSKEDIGDKTRKVFKKIVKVGDKGISAAKKAYKYSPKLSSNLMRQFTASANPSSGGRTQAGPGRPRGVLKHRSPFNGQPIPATEFYKQMRAFRRQQSQTADQIQTQRQAQFARQGVPPSQIQQAVQQRMQQQFLMQQQMQRQPQPYRQNIPPQFQRPVVPSRPIQLPNSNQQIDINNLPDGTIIPMGNANWKFARGKVGTDWGLFGRRKVIFGAESSFTN